MKTVIHKCDFCGAHPSGRMAQLTVPLSKEERALRAKAGAKPSPNPGYSPVASLYANLGFFPSHTEEDRTMTYDICRECVRGLLMCRFQKIAKLATGNEDE